MIIQLTNLTNKLNKRHTLLLGWLLIFACNGQRKDEHAPMKFSEFRKMVITNSEYSQKNFNPSVDEAIKMTKMFNTINSYLLTDTVFTSYTNRFLGNYVSQIAEKLEAKVTMGMGYYSSKYHLYIGGPSNFVSGSYYELDKSTLPKSATTPN